MWVYVNKIKMSVRVDGDTQALWVIRDAWWLTGTKYDCGTGVCRACTIDMDGIPIRSCIYPIANTIGHHITAIEGLPQNGTHPVQDAWVAEKLPQCGCQSRQTKGAAAPLVWRD